MWFLELHLLQGMLKHDVDYSRFSLKNRILLRATHIMGLPFSTKWKTQRYEKVSRRCSTGDDLCMSNGAFELMMHIWHPWQFEEKMEADFEHLRCLIPVKYKEVLTILRDHGYNGYLLSEYEGADKYDPGYEVGQTLRKHHIMMKNILGY